MAGLGGRDTSRASSYVSRPQCRLPNSWKNSGKTPLAGAIPCAIFTPRSRSKAPGPPVTPPSSHRQPTPVNPSPPVHIPMVDRLCHYRNGRVTRPTRCFCVTHRFQTAAGLLSRSRIDNCSGRRPRSIDVQVLGQAAGHFQAPHLLILSQESEGTGAAAAAPTRRRRAPPGAGRGPMFRNRKSAELARGHPLGSASPRPSGTRKSIASFPCPSPISSL